LSVFQLVCLLVEFQMGTVYLTAAYLTVTVYPMGVHQWVALHSVSPLVWGLWAKSQ
jgi:hypothetical protein